MKGRPDALENKQKRRAQRGILAEERARATRGMGRPVALAAAVFAAFVLVASCRSSPMPDLGAIDPETVPLEYSGGGNEWKTWSQARDPRLGIICGLPEAGRHSHVLRRLRQRLHQSHHPDRRFRPNRFNAEILKENVCGRPAPVEYEKCVEDFLQGSNVSALRGKLFRASLGTGLSC